ncbi:MAG: chemotaxis protein A [Rhodobacterales bacterium]|nr:MAG: chemotaxis protein A [Rhodobacterales bacterium]
MLQDLSNALETWDIDNKKEKLPGTAEEKHILTAIDNKIAVLRSYIEKIESGNQDLQEIFDLTYADCHFITGFGQIMGSQKTFHLGMLAELIADSARYFQTYSNYSMSYLLGLLIEKLAQVTKDLKKDRNTSLDITDVVSECAIYLTDPISEILKETAEKREARLSNSKAIQEKAAKEKETAPPPTSNTIAAPNKFVDLEQEEEEILNIPNDKVGLISDFCEEAWESLQASENLLIELENNPTSKELINELFRAVHTVKGGSRLIEVKKIEKLSHELETVLDNVRSDKIMLDARLIDISLECIKRIGIITDEVAHRGPIKTKINDLLHALISGDDAVDIGVKSNQNVEKVTPEQTTIKSPETKPQDTKANAPPNVVREESIKVSAEKLDTVLNTSSEVYINRIRLDNDQKMLSDALEQINQDIGSLNKEFTSEISNSEYENNVSSLIPKYQTDINIGLEKIAIHNANLQKNIEDLEVLSSRLQSGAMNFRMLPISNLFNRFPAQVRDIARQIGKKVELKIQGGETELDKILINQLADPLLHLIRNSIDHGIEADQQRAAINKPEIGQINLSAYYLGSNAIIEIEDDGKGIDSKIIAAKAVEKNLLSNERASELSEKEIFDLIFEPGFSSAEQVTELSGRGVGMDVVKTSINQMQGSIKVESKVNQGTKITLRLPLTLAVVGILLVSENNYEFAFPILNVEEIINVNLKTDIKSINDTLVFNFRGELVPTRLLSDFLGYPKNPKYEENKFLLILNDGENKIGVIVDEVQGQQNVLLKQLGNLIETAPFVIGCTILSNSKLVLILNVLELTQYNPEQEKNSLSEEVHEIDTSEQKRSLQKVLVVDDSKMQRKRICEFLQIQGYNTDEAGDGFEALKTADKTNFNAFFVDIQMPLMDGYELIENLRKTSSYKNTPIFVISGGHVNKENILTRLEDLNVANFYEKPVDLEALIAELDSKLSINNEKLQSGLEK